jgi:AcrR family transcriptional regulator
MVRPYTLKRRAESQAKTRRRIVEAAIDLHATVGPANTTISMIAERAGVQRHTFYSHFPDERSMLMACSGHSLERDPLPDAAPWRAIVDPAERLRTGLREIYDWYERNGDLVACVLRDAEHHPLVREIRDLRYGPGVAGWRQTLGDKLNAKQRAMLAVALSFHTWRTLTHDAGMKQAAAANAMALAVAQA